jgi:hypothetical protein
LKIFFVQYNDPVYVQVEKVELMIMLATDDNIDTVLEELMETTEKVHSFPLPFPFFAHPHSLLLFFLWYARAVGDLPPPFVLPSFFNFFVG